MFTRTHITWYTRPYILVVWSPDYAAARSPRGPSPHWLREGLMDGRCSEWWWWWWWWRRRRRSWISYGEEMSAFGRTIHSGLHTPRSVIQAYIQCCVVPLVWYTLYTYMYSGYRRHCLPIVTSGKPNEPLCARPLTMYSSAGLRAPSFSLSRTYIYMYAYLSERLLRRRRRRSISIK